MSSSPALRALTVEERAQMPVSVARVGPRKQAVISRFGDSIWDFWPYIPHENRADCMKRLNWSLPLPDGTSLTDAKHSVLLESAKLFLWSLYAEPIDGRKRPSMTSVVHKFWELTSLLRWMVSQGIGTFAGLEGHTLDFVVAAKIPTRGTKIEASTVRRRLAIVESIYHQREKLNDALRSHPWLGESSISLAGERKSHKPKTELIAEPVVSRLAQIAIEYVTVRAPRLFAARAKFDRITAALSHRHPVHATIARTKEARRRGFAGQAEVDEELARLRTACYIAIDLFSGIRDSEVMSLPVNCVSRGSARDGIEVLWMRGTIYKTGVRPMKWIVPPIVRKAVDVLTELTQPGREIMAVELTELEEVAKTAGKLRSEVAARLAKLRVCADKLFLTFGSTGAPIQVISGTQMSVNLKKFCEHHAICGADGRPYRLHSHQFRRTYAHYVARSELGDLLMLREHFGHWSIDMTLLYADGGADDYDLDTELLEWIAEEKQGRQREILSEMARSKTPVVDGGWLERWRQKVRTASDKERLVQEMSDTITLNGTGHSWCVGNAKGTGCGGLCVFEADMCVDCRYGVITLEHEPVWRGIREQQIQVLEMADLGVPGKARAQAILLKAEKVLAKLSGGSGNGRG